MNLKGKVIVLEGACDGIGKSTQYQKLYDRLIEEGYEVVRHHFPTYGTQQGGGVERYLKGDFGSPEDLSPYFINNLFAYDRAITWKTELEKEYEKGKIILLDRYTPSSLIYQTANIKDIEERKQIIKFLADLEYNKLGIKEPDLVLFLTMPFELATEMRINRKENDGIINDIHEANLAFMKKVYDNSQIVADELNFYKVYCNIDNKIKTIDDIHEEVYQKTIKVLKRR